MNGLAFAVLALAVCTGAGLWAIARALDHLARAVGAEDELAKMGKQLGKSTEALRYVVRDNQPPARGK